MSRRRVFHGWWSVLALSVTETVSYGILYDAFTVFVTPLARELDASIASVAGAYAVGAVVSGLLAGQVGVWLDRHGARGLMTAGSLLAGTLLMAWSMIETLVGLYVVWTLMGFALATVLDEPAFAVLAVWFERRRSAALTLLTSVAGFASAICHLVTAAIFLAQAAGVATLLACPGPVGLGAFVLLYGIGFGAITPARAALVVETFGPAWYGTIAGRLALIGTMARAAAPVALGWLVDRGAGYDGALGALIALALVAAVTVTMAGRSGARAASR